MSPVNNASKSLREISRHIVGGLLISADGKVLLGENRQGGVFGGMLVVPGGGIDEGETEEQALRREMLEEIGIDIAGAEIRKVNVGTGSSEKTLRETGERVLVRMQFHDYVVQFASPASELTPKVEDDFCWAQWFDKEELVGRRFSSPTAALLVKLGFLPEGDYATT